MPPVFVLGVVVCRPTLRVLLTTDGCDANLAHAMLIEHTHLHIRALNPTRGEFLLIKLLIGDDAPQTGFRLENWSDIPWQTSDEERWECIRSGAFEALRAKGIEDATVCVVAVRYLDVDSPPSLFESAARVCVLLALENPEKTFTESGDRRFLARWKEKQRDLLEELGVV